MKQHYIKAGKRYQPVNPWAGLNESVLILCAVRYALGGGSYSPSCVMEFCRENWGQLELRTRHVIMRDVLEWLGERHEWVKPGQHDMAWPDLWRIFLRWAMAQDAKETDSARRALEWERDQLQGVDEFFGGAA